MHPLWTTDKAECSFIHIHINQRHIKHIKGHVRWDVLISVGGLVEGGGCSGSSVGGPMFPWSGWSKHLSAWIRHPKELLAMTPYNIHMLTAQTGKFEHDAASSWCVCEHQDEAPAGTNASARATRRLFPVFFRKVDSTCGGLEGGERGWRENVCVFI